MIGFSVSSLHMPGSWLGDPAFYRSGDRHTSAAVQSALPSAIHRILPGLVTGHRCIRQFVFFIIQIFSTWLHLSGGTQAVDDIPASINKYINNSVVVTISFWYFWHTYFGFNILFSIFCHFDVLFSIFCHFDILRSIFYQFDVLRWIFCHFDILFSIFCHLDILFSIFCHFDILSFDILSVDILHSIFCPSIFYFFDILLLDIPQYDILLIRYFAYSIFCDSIFCFSIFCPEPV